MNTQVLWQWVAFDELTASQMEAMFALRQKVFIVEQECLYLDIDGLDSQAIHCLGWANGQLVATLRVFKKFEAYDNCSSFGRICVDKFFRNQGVGRELVSNALAWLDNNWLDKNGLAQNKAAKAVQIGAQEHLKGFYQSLGFKQVSESYEEDGIPHILMRLKPS